MELNIIDTGSERCPVLLDNQMRIVKPVFDFLKFQKLKGLSENSIEAYGWDLKLYFEFLCTRGLRYDEVIFSTIGEFIEFLRDPDSAGSAFLCMESKRTAKTINRILGTVHNFYRYHAMVGGINNPILVQDVSKPASMFKSMLEHARKDNFIKKSVFKVKESTYAVRLMAECDAERFLNALPTQRDKLIFKTMYLTGARIGEVLNLRIEDIPFPDRTKQLGVLRDIVSKGKRRDLYIPMDLVEELDAFILGERSKIETQHSYIFVSQQKNILGKPLTYRGVYEVFRRIGRLTGIDFRCHDVRHTVITKLVESGMDISVVRIIAGHKHVTTTQEYLHISSAYLVDSLGRYWSRSSLLGGGSNAK